MSNQTENKPCPLCAHNASFGEGYQARLLFCENKACPLHSTGLSVTDWNAPRPGEEKARREGWEAGRDAAANRVEVLITRETYHLAALTGQPQTSSRARANIDAVMAIRALQYPGEEG